MIRKIEPPNPTAEALVAIADAVAPPLPREARIPMPVGDPEAPDRAPPVPYAKPNGNQPRDARDALARGLLQFDVLKAERDQLEKDLQVARERIDRLEIHISEIEATRGTIESRINTCILERDDAVRQAGELRGVINSVAAICVRYHDAQQQD